MTDHPVDLPRAIEFWKPKYLLGMRLAVVGVTEVASRPCAVVQAFWRDGPYPDDLDILLAVGVDELRLAVDLERGVILRWRSYFEGEAVSEFLVEQIEFDSPLDEDLFRCPSLTVNG